MNILAACRYIVLPLVLWRAKRRSKRDNTFTPEEIERFHHQLKSRKP